MKERFKSIVLFPAKFYKTSSHPFWVWVREKGNPALQDFLLTGPALIGFVVGIWREDVGSKRFLIAVQSMFLFCIYIFLLALTHFTYLLTNCSQCAAFGDSILAFAYIAITLFLFIKLQKGRVVIHRWVLAFWGELQPLNK